MSVQTEIGVTIDAFVWNKWHVADIIDVKDNYIQLSLYGWSTDTINSATINKNDYSSIAPLHQHTTPIIRLKEPPKLQYGTPRPIYFASKSDKLYYIKRGLIISPPYSDEYVYKYDIVKDEYFKFRKYPSNLKPSFHSTALSIKDDLVYIIGGENNCFSTLHLDTGDWNVLIDKQTNTISRAVFNWNTNQLYLFSDEMKAFKYNSNEYTISECSNEIHEMEINGRPIFIPFTNTFMIFTSDKIWYSDGDLMALKWKLYNNGNTIIPPTNNKNKEFYTVLAFDTLIFIIYLFNDREIQILNLFDNKWFKSNMKYPYVDCESVSIVNSFDNYIHVIDTWMRYHFKIHLLDLIPIQMYTYYQSNKYNKLIDGYVRKHNLTHSLAQLILLYYPIWYYL